MKTKLPILCIVSLLLCACGEKAGRPAGSSGNENSPRDTRGGVLLKTDLPPEHLEGTPCPIVLSPCMADEI